MDQHCRAYSKTYVHEGHVILEERIEAPCCLANTSMLNKATHVLQAHLLDCGIPRYLSDVVVPQSLSLLLIGPSGEAETTAALARWLLKKQPQPAAGSKKQTNGGIFSHFASSNDQAATCQLSDSNLTQCLEMSAGLRPGVSPGAPLWN